MLKNVVDVIAAVGTFLLLQLYLWIPVLFLVTIFFASIFVPFKLGSYADIITLITVLCVILSFLLVVRKYLVRPFQAGKKKTKKRINQNLASNEPLPSKKRNFANAETYDDDVIQKSTAFKKSSGRKKYIADSEFNQPTLPQNENSGKTYIDALSIQNQLKPQKNKLFTNNISGGSALTAAGFYNKTDKPQPQDTKPALKPDYPPHTTQPHTPPKSVQPQNYYQENQPQYIQNNTYAENAPKYQNNPPYAENAPKYQNNPPYGESNTQTQANVNSSVSGNLIPPQPQQPAQNAPQPQPQSVTPAPEQPRYLRTRKDPNLIIAEYNDRLEFYKRTITGLVYLTTETKE